MASCTTLMTPESAALTPRPLWTTVFVVGVVFFFVGDGGHDVFISQFDDYSPWADEALTLSGGALVKGCGLMILAGLGVFFLGQTAGRRLRLQGLLPLFVIGYVGWAFLSVVWSSEPMMTVCRVGPMLLCVVAAMGVAWRLAPRDLAVVGLVVPGVWLVIGFAAEVALGSFRPWAEGYRFAGTVHPNLQGAHLAILCLSALVLVPSVSSRNRRKLLWAVFVVGLVFLLLTRSRTSLAGLMLAGGAIWLVRAPSANRILLVTSAIFVLAVGALGLSMLGSEAEQWLVDTAALGRREESGQLTGRLPVWSELARHVSDRPLTGYGYESFWTTTRIEQISDQVGWRLREAHSGYLDTCLSVGLVGCGLLLSGVALALIGAARLCRTTADPGYGLAIGLVCLGLMSAAMESIVAGTNFTSLLIGCAMLQVMFAWGDDELSTTAPTPHREPEPHNSIAKEPDTGC